MATKLVPKPCLWRPRTPFYIRFPTGRRYFKTEDAAHDAIGTFLAGRPSRLSAAQQDEYLACFDLLAGRSVRVLDAVRFYLQAVPEGETMKLADCVAAYLKQQEENVGDVHYEAQSRTLRSLVAEFPKRKMGELTGKEIRRWIDSHHKGSREQKYTHTRAFIAWAAADEQEFASPALLKIGKKPRTKTKNTDEIHFLEVDDALTMLQLTRDHAPRYLGALALKLFSGIRSFEMGRMDWQAVSMDRGKIKVDAAAAKRSRGEARPRTIDWIPDNLPAWMEICEQEGSICPGGERGFAKWSSSWLFPRARDLGVDVRKNDLRHTYATYATAWWEGREKVAMQMGHASTAMLMRHYMAWAEKKEAIRFFGLTPSMLEAAPKRIPTHAEIAEAARCDRWTV